MADTAYTALGTKTSRATTDKEVIVSGGVPYQTSYPLPAITSDGKVGIGATPSKGLHLTGSTTDTATIRAQGTGAAAGTLQLQTAGSVFELVGGNGLKFNQADVATRAVFDGSGNFGLGTSTPFSTNGTNFDITGQPARLHLVNGNISTGRRYWLDSLSDGTFSITDGSASVQRVVITAGGEVLISPYTNNNLLVGATSGAEHRIAKNVAEGSAVLYIYGSALNVGAVFQGVSQQGFNSAGAALQLGKHATTGRTLNGGGTINASGADYAEYLKKALAYLEAAFLKGQVLGIDKDGNLTCRWSEAHSFVIKSYNPSYVGGDTWASHLKLPTEPVFTAPVYTGPAEPVEIAPWQVERPQPTELPAEPPAVAPAQPAMPVRGAGEDNDAWTLRLVGYANERAQWEAAYAMWQMAVAHYPDLVREIEEADTAALAAYEAAVAAHAKAVADHAEAMARYDAAQRAFDAAFDAARIEHDAAMATYAADLAAFEQAMEEARATVDRIAFSGQVPVIVTGDCAPGTNADPVYLVAFEADEDAIECRALPWSQIIADPTRLLETRVVGKVWTIRNVQLDPADTSPEPVMVTRAWANVLHR